MARLNIRLVEDRILVEPQAAQDVTIGGIIIPDNAKEKPQRGKVVLTGPGKLSKEGVLTPVNPQVNETVIYGKFSGTEILVNNICYVIIRESDVLAIIPEGE